MSKVRALAKARAARTLGPEEVMPLVEPAPGVAGRVNEQAIRAYRAMLPSEIERGPIYHADQIMQRKVITVPDDEHVGRAWQALQDHRIHQAPVLDGGARLIGIVSERDLLTAINIDAGRIVESLNKRVREVMSTPVVCAVPVTDIRRIASVMLSHGVDGVPITNESGRLIGFVSRGDILRAVVTDPPLRTWR